jgi:hypothetical protein
MSNNNSNNGDSYEPWNKWVATADHVAVPQAIFTDPQFASVGFTEKDAHRLNINVRAVDYDHDTLQGIKVERLCAHISLFTYSIKEMVYCTVSILCIVAWMFYNGNITTD